MNRKFAVVLLLMMFARLASAVEPACSPRQPVLRVKRADLFTDQQEQWLGDAEADMIEPRYTLLPATESTYLDEIGQRLLQQLPPTPIHYTFRIYESPDLRAFSLPGGYVYISRKLVMDARSEDELAAMLAQEIGRIYIHHGASSVTRRMKGVLHVKKLGDRADVYDKFERMLNMPTDEYDYLTPGEQEDDELMADRVGMYAMLKAHYNPKAFATFLDRVNENGGFTGNLFTDALDVTPLIALRVRMADKAVSSLPATCKDPRPMYRPDFAPFQQAIEQQRIDPIVPPTAGMDSSALQQPMDPALENVVISPDGRYLLAQDAYQIHVLSTSPLKVLFSIDALGAEMAQFSPDSQSVVFNYNDLHVEKWQVATGQPSNIEDFVDYAGCTQTSLAPDGSTLACISQFVGIFADSVWLKLADLESNSMVYQNLHFFDKGTTIMNDNVRMTPNFQALMHWSRDGRYFVATSGTSAMAYDLKNHRTVRLEGALSGLAQQRFAFVGPDKMASTCDWDYKTGAAGETFRMCYTTFPGGQTLKKFQLAPGWLATMAAGDHLLFGPLVKAAAALFDPATERVEQAFQNESVDVRDDDVAMEVPDGGVGYGKLGADVDVLRLPVTPLTAIEASAFSPNGRYVAVSDRVRGAEWDLSTGKRVALTAPFRAVDIDDAGHLQAALVPHELNPSSSPGLDRLMHRYVPGLSPLMDPLQFGSARIRFVPLGVRGNYGYDIRMEANDAQTEAHLWSQTFLTRVPQMVEADGDRTVMTMNRVAWMGGAKLIHTSDLPRQFLNPEGTVVAVVSNRTGKAEHAYFAPQLPGSDWRSDDRSAVVFGNLLAVYGNNNDTSIYRASDGKRLFGFFGSALAGDDTLGMVAGTNRIQELNIYDTASGKRLLHALLDQAMIAARFVPEHKQLLVLTAGQRVYRIDLSKLTAAH
ncbi:MAG: M48 family metalloprotease [Acidobacteriota bacterium]